MEAAAPFVVLEKPMIYILSNIPAELAFPWVKDMYPIACEHELIFDLKKTKLGGIS
jgi:hypothetical protein